MALPEVRCDEVFPRFAIPPEAAPITLEQTLAAEDELIETGFVWISANPTDR